MMELKDIEAEFQIKQITPSRLAEIRVILSGKYAFATNKLEEILLQKAKVWHEMRQDYKSVADTDRAWESSNLGLEEMHWKLQIKKIEKMLSASKSLLDVKTTEAYNLT